MLLFELQTSISRNPRVMEISGFRPLTSVRLMLACSRSGHSDSWLTFGRARVSPSFLPFVSKIVRRIGRGGLMGSPSLRRITLLLVPCLLCFPVLAQRSQSGPGVPVRTSIRGTVRDAVTHRPLERVVLMIDDRQSGYAGQAETDSSGKFELQGLGETAYAINIRFPGYYEATQNVDLSTNPMAYLSFELRPKPGTAPPAVAPEGPEARLDARHAAVPEKAGKEFAKARELWQEGKDPQGCVDHLHKAIKAYPKFGDAYALSATADMPLTTPPLAKSALDNP